MVDNDLILLNINKAVLPWRILLQAMLDNSDLCWSDTLSHDLAKEDLGIRILVDLVAFGDRIDEIAIGFCREPVPRLAGLGLASVEVLSVSLAVDVGYRHGGTSIE